MKRVKENEKVTQRERMAREKKQYPLVREKYMYTLVPLKHSLQWIQVM